MTLWCWKKGLSSRCRLVGGKSGVIWYGEGRGVRLSSGLYMLNTPFSHPSESHPLEKIFFVSTKNNLGRSSVK